MTIKRKWVGLLWVLVGLLQAGCNTVKGVGQDIHDGAQGVQDAIEYESGKTKSW